MALLQIYEPGQTPLPHAEDAQDLVIGIDLGTTHSLVSLVVDDQPQVLRFEGNPLVPSVVFYPDNGAPLVGTLARQAFLEGRKGAYIPSIKRLMAQREQELKNISLPYEVVFQEGRASVRVGEALKSPVEISADILKYLKAQTEVLLDQPVHRVVITVPAYFSEAARAATRQAAKIAGLDVLRLLSEPTAAAIAYDLDQRAGTYLVYDLGGGTFDVTLLRAEEGIFQVLGVGGDALLGGDDIDHALMMWLCEKEKIEPTSTLLADARRIKETLTTQDEMVWHNSTVTRAILASLAQPFLDKTLHECRRVLKEADVTLSDLSEMILVGGSTRAPWVVDGITQFLGRSPLCSLNPDEVVALGAGMQAHRLSTGSGALLLDVLPLSLGLETMGGLVEKLIPRNTAIPVTVAQEFTTYQDNQTAMTIHVVQGEREFVQDCRSLARFSFKGIPPMVAGMARVMVTFTVDADGLLCISAQEQLTGHLQTLEIQPSHGLSEDEMFTLLREGFEHGEDDMTARLLAQERVEAERTLLALQSIDMTSDEKSVLEPAVKHLQTCMAGNDRDAIHEALEALERAATPLAERRMSAALTTHLKGCAIL